MLTKILFLIDQAPTGSVVSALPCSPIPENLTIATAAAQGPSLLLTRQFKHSDELGVLAVEVADVISAMRGPDSRWLIIRDALKNDAEANRVSGYEFNPEIHLPNLPTSAFTDYCRSISQHISELANAVSNGLLEIDPTFALERKVSGRWVSTGVNFVTLKPQPRNNDLQFTIYGNPNDFNHNGFLRKDQNSYSRGWIKSINDVEAFLYLARQSYQKRAS